MTMKRKRNDLDSSPSSSSASWSRFGSLSPSPSHYGFDFRFQSPWQEQVARPQFAWPSVDNERHNSSGRTLKRFRDNRPDEQAIYTNTFRKLFEAQRVHSQPQQQYIATESPVPPTSMPDAMDTTDATPQTEHQPQLKMQPKSQSSLHKFFNISRAPTSMAMPLAEPAFQSSHRCQDCDSDLLVSGDDMMMDDGYNGQGSAWSCGRCGRTVCDLCAIVDCGTGRECLMCRTGS